MTTKTLTQAENFIDKVFDLTRYQIKYLSWRICGFDDVESKDFSNVSESMLVIWKQQPEFILVELSIGELRNEFKEILLENQFDRNQRLAMDIDTQVLTKAVDTGLDNLTEVEASYLKSIRGQYNKEIRKNIGADKGVTLNWSEMMITIRNANAQNDQPGNQIQEFNNQESVIEAEYTESSTE